MARRPRARHHRPMRVAVVALSLLAYNNLLNRWSRFDGAMYVTLNLGASAALVTVAAAWLDLSPSDLGFHGSFFDILVGAALGAAVSLPLVIASLSRRAASFVADRRVEGLEGAALAFQLLIRIPLGTVLLEEVAFRGVLFAAWRSLGTPQAAWLSSAAFGLWHIGATINLVDINRASAPRRTYVVAVISGVAFTAAAGMALIWLRVLSSGLLAPFAAHGMVNVGGTVAALLAHRRLRR